jgi:hypothetical protein
MNILQDSVPTSNDLLSSLVAKHAPATLNYKIVAQSAEDVQDIDNAPAITMGTLPPQDGKDLSLEDDQYQ